jgi:hypothetical protein
MTLKYPLADEEPPIVKAFHGLYQPITAFCVPKFVAGLASSLNVINDLGVVASLSATTSKDVYVFCPCCQILNISPVVVEPTSRGLSGPVVPIPTLPFPNITNLSTSPVCKFNDLAVESWPISIPTLSIWKCELYPLVLLAEKSKCADGKSIPTAVVSLGAFIVSL